MTEQGKGVVGPGDFLGRFETSYCGKKVRAIYGQHGGSSTAWCSTEAEARQLALAAIRCREEWEAVNDPPCHPADVGWKPCVVCIPAKATGADQ